MFTIDDDFDVDEDFLSNAFETTANRSNADKVLKERSFNRSEVAGRPSQAFTHSETDTSDHESQKEVFENRNAEFLKRWNSNENNLFNVLNSPKQSDPRSKIDISRAISPKGFKTEVFTRSSKNVRSRKFPGPAGLLPERNSSTSFIVPEEYISGLENDSENVAEFEGQEVFSQNTNNLFEEPEGPWQKMMHDLGQQGKHLISTINLSTLQGKQTRNGFKVPFLAVFVQNIDCSLPDPSVLLKDEKEEINGTLHRDLWEDWKEEIVVGSVMVLRNVGVISAGSSRRYFLNITANNIVTIYSPTKESNIKMIQMNSSSKMDTSVILDEWEKLLKQNRQPPSPAVCSEQFSIRPLFNVFSPGPSQVTPMPHRPPPVRPQFSNPSKLRPTSQSRGRFSGGSSGIRHSIGYRHNQNTPPTRFTASSPAPSNTSQCSPFHSASQQSNKDVSTPSPLLKRPRTLEPSPSQTEGKPMSNSFINPNSKTSIFNISDSPHSIVESVLDGIDTDSLFEDF